MCMTGTQLEPYWGGRHPWPELVCKETVHLPGGLPELFPLGPPQFSWEVLRVGAGMGNSRRKWLRVPRQEDSPRPALHWKGLFTFHGGDITGRASMFPDGWPGQNLPNKV